MLLPAAIFLELVIVVVALLIAARRKRLYGYGFALTFGIYVFYDLARFYEWGLPEGVREAVFLIATISALVSMMLILAKP